MPKTQNILPFSFPQFDERNNERDQNIDDELQRMEDELEKMFSNFMGGMNLFNRMFDMNDQHINQFN